MFVEQGKCLFCGAAQQDHSLFRTTVMCPKPFHEDVYDRPEVMALPEGSFQLFMLDDKEYGYFYCSPGRFALPNCATLGDKLNLSPL